MGWPIWRLADPIAVFRVFSFIYGFEPIFYANLTHTYDFSPVVMSKKCTRID
jgi:hypothetical protein